MIQSINSFQAFIIRIRIKKYTDPSTSPVTQYIFDQDSDDNYDIHTLFEQHWNSRTPTVYQKSSKYNKAFTNFI